MGYNYDFATKLWTTIFAKIVMLLIQWPALFTALLQSPNHRGNMAWNVIACLIPIAVATWWTVDAFMRKQNPVVWIVFVIAELVWLFISIGLVNP